MVVAVPAWILACVEVAVDVLNSARCFWWECPSSQGTLQAEVSLNEALLERLLLKHCLCVDIEPQQVTNLTPRLGSRNTKRYQCQET